MSSRFPRNGKFSNGFPIGWKLCTSPLFAGLVLICAVALLSTSITYATTIVLPPEALPDMELMSSARFKARWPQVEIPDGYYPVEKGFWMTYQHQKLTYFFGPHETREGAEASQQRMERIKDDLLRKDAARFASARTGILYLEFKPDGQGQPTTVAPQPPQVLDGDGSTGSSSPMSGMPSQNKGIRRVINSGSEEGAGDSAGNPEDSGNPLGGGEETPATKGEEEGVDSADNEGASAEPPTGTETGSEAGTKGEEGSETSSETNEASSAGEEAMEQAEVNEGEESGTEKPSNSTRAEPSATPPSGGESSSTPQQPSSPTQNQQGQPQSGESQDSNTGEEEPPDGPKFDTSKIPEPPIQSPQQDKVEEPEDVPLIIKILKRIFG